MADGRPDPDALLAHVETAETQPRRGRLKLFFGMSAGVGKTFAMLSEAQEKRRAGIDVVLGYIETHKRPETDALKSGLEELPALVIEYRGVQLREFDLDAALRRKPALILVDELAHTNAEGLRHAKRWQDVVELLESGIDVSTTVNVQHVESLNDVVAQITGIPVRETVPDSIIERADEIELIDIPPDDLLQRLREGKVYITDQVARAVEQFFRRDNLVALRELALRETAQRVGAQLLTERAVRGDTRPWATGERILVCVGPSPLSARVIRTARRMAAASKSDWTAAAVETPGMSQVSAAQVRRNLKLAERLGAESIVLAGERVVDEILAYAVRHNVNKIVIGKTSLPRWREWLRGSFVNELLRRSGEIDVHIVKGDAEEVVDERSVAVGRGARPRDYLVAAGVIGICTLLAALAFSCNVSPVNLTMIYLVGVVFVATRHTVGPSAMASVLAALLFDFLFIPPYFSFAISDTQYLIAFGALLTTALVISGLGQRVRRQNDDARMRYLRTAALYFMSRQLAATSDAESLTRVAARHISDVFQGDAAILLPGKDGALESVPALPSAAPGGESSTERGAAQWTFDHVQWSGWSTDTLPACRAMYLPLIAGGKSLGVLALRPHVRERQLDPDQRHLLETFATQLAIALERTRFASQADAARRATETEQLRNSLLSCVSHDLRTPLATIAGSASALLSDEGRLAEDQRRELLTSIYEEGGRLNQLVQKLLEMTRLQSPGFAITRDWFPVADLVGSALTRLEQALREHTIQTDIPSGLPLVSVDGVLIEEVLINLLENAIRYTPRGSIIRVSARAIDGELRIEVSDNGPGLPDGAEQAVFDKFYRGRPRTDRSGTGLGLAICRAVIELHGGRISARNLPDGGACFSFTVPRGENAPGDSPGALMEATTSARDDSPPRTKELRE